MWFLYLTNAFQPSITANLTPYVTSGFEQHSLLTVIQIVSNSMAAAVYIPTAKLLDLWGRAEGFAVMVCFATGRSQHFAQHKSSTRSVSVA
jgi:hypothetical protein